MDVPVAIKKTGKKEWVALFVCLLNVSRTTVVAPNKSIDLVSDYHCQLQKSPFKIWILGYASKLKAYAASKLRNMWKIFSLVPSKKNSHQRKLRQTKCLFFNFWMMKFTVIPKKVIWHLAIWQNWCYGQFYYSKIEK